MSNTLPPERIRAETELHIRRALARIQKAQDELAYACQELSPIVGGCPLWRATSKLHDRVHAMWYRVESLRMKARHQKSMRIRLDDTNIDALVRREAQQP